MALEGTRVWLASWFRLCEPCASEQADGVGFALDSFRKMVIVIIISE